MAPVNIVNKNEPLYAYCEEKRTRELEKLERERERRNDQSLSSITEIFQFSSSLIFLVVERIETKSSKEV